MAKAKFCLFIDTEADFWRYIPSPHFNKKEILKWHLNKISMRFSRGRKGLLNVVRVLKNNKFPATFTIVGHLYLKGCKGYPHFNEILPEAWLKRVIGKRWDYWDPRSNFRLHPGLYLGDFIEGEMKEPYFDLGLHAFTHESLTLESKDVVDSCIESAIKAAKLVGVKPVSFGAPFNMIEDIKDPKKVYSALKKNGIKIVRFVGKEYGLKQMHKDSVRNLFKKGGLKAVQVSHYFEGNSSLSLIRKILGEIKGSIGKEIIYCLGTHDFTHKNTNNLQMIIKLVLRLEEEGKIKIVNMKQLLK